MVEEKEQQKRQIAYRIMIKDILSGRYTKEKGWSPNHIILEDGRKISRINIIGTIINKQIDDGFNYNDIKIDDGSGNIVSRVFDNKELFNNINVGDSVILIGRPREFGSIRYIIPEILKKIENKDWIRLRQLELNKKEIANEENVSNISNIGQISKKENVKIEDVDEVCLEEKNNFIVFSIVKELDKGDGANFNDVIEKLDDKKAENIINNMIKQGELFEIRPGRIKTLE